MQNRNLNALQHTVEGSIGTTSCCTSSWLLRYAERCWIATPAMGGLTQTPRQKVWRESNSGAVDASQPINNSAITAHYEDHTQAGTEGHTLSQTVMCQLRKYTRQLPGHKAGTEARTPTQRLGLCMTLIGISIGANLWTSIPQACDGSSASVTVDCLHTERNQASVLLICSLNGLNPLGRAGAAASGRILTQRC